MLVASPVATRLRFQDFEVDLRAGELRRNRLKVRLPEKPFQVLAALLENPGEVVTRDELRQRLWPGDTFVEFDDNLNHAVKTLREALTDSAEQPRFVETLPRHGYRFIAPVEIPARRSPRLLTLALVALPGLLAVLLALNVAGLRNHLLGRMAPGQISSLAVLPLDNLSGDPEQEYFADGMTEALITELGKVGALRVISRQSVMQYKSSDKSLSEIARELNVDAVVEGSAVREGNRVRITVQLVLAAPEQHLWAESYEKDLGSALELQGAVAEDIVRKIRATLRPGEEKRLARAGRIDPQVLDAYLQGLYYRYRAGPGDLPRALEQFQYAIKRDAQFAPAYAEMGGIYLVLVDGSELPPAEGYSKAKEAAQKALEIDESLGQAHVVRAGLLELERNWIAAEKEYARAVQLNPSYLVGHQWYSVFLSNMGRHEEAIARAKHALTLAPTSAILVRNLGTRLYFAHQHDAAIEQYRKAIELNPEYTVARFFLGHPYLAKGMYDEAIAAYREGLVLEPQVWNWWGWLGYAYALAGKKEEALQVLNHLRKQSEDAYVPTGAFARVHLGLGERDRFLTWLEEALDAGYDAGYGLQTLRVEPALDSLRSDPRFQSLLRRLNFPD